MFDSHIRPLIDPPLARLAAIVVHTGISANTISVLGACAALGAGGAIATRHFGWALTLIAASRLLDGLDGAVARIRGKTDFGGYLDAVCDFVFYAAIPLGFALADPRSALPAASLLASFLLSSVSFLGFAAIANRRGLLSSKQGAKSFYYLAGLAEGAETIAVFVLAVLMPQWFVPLAYGFAALCVLTAIGRLIAARRLLA